MTTNFCVLTVRSTCNLVFLHSSIHSCNFRSVSVCPNSAGAGTLSLVEGFNSNNAADPQSAAAYPGVAIRYSGRETTGNGPQYEARNLLDYRCLTGGSQWRVQARIKILRGGTNVGATCEVGSASTEAGCPNIVVRLYGASNPDQPFFNHRLRQYASSTWIPNGFNLFTDTVTIPADAERVVLAHLVVRNFHQDLDVVVDDFSIQQV